MNLSYGGEGWELTGDSKTEISSPSIQLPNSTVYPFGIRWAPEQIRCLLQRFIFLQRHQHHSRLSASRDDDRLAIVTNLVHGGGEVLSGRSVGDRCHGAGRYAAQDCRSMSPTGSVFGRQVCYRLGSDTTKGAAMNPAQDVKSGCLHPLVRGCSCGCGPSPTHETDTDCWWCGEELNHLASDPQTPESDTLRRNRAYSTNQSAYLARWIKMVCQ